MLGKLVLLGDASVGKSSIALRAISNTFSEQQLSTLGAAFMNYTVQVNGQDFRFDIWDTAGQERFQSIAPMYYRSAQFVLVVYDVSVEQSLEKAKKWVAEVKLKTTTPSVIMTLVANKADLPREEWKVDQQAAQAYAAKEGMLFSETSAKTGLNVVETFVKMAERFVQPNAADKKEDTATTKITMKESSAVSAKGGCC